MNQFFKKLTCKVIGHNIDPCDCYATECFRCGLTFHYDDPPRDDLGFWLSWCEFKPGRWWRFTARPWIRCDYCGGRFGRHDKDRCIPF